VKKILFLISAVCFVFAACTTGGKKSYKQYRGINYDAYEQQKQREGAGFNLDVTQGDIDAQSFGVLEFDAEGNEIIESTGSSYGEAVVVMAAKKIYLSRDASQKDITVFQNALDEAYRTAMKEYRPVGFTYSMSPAGAVNPLAIMDVQCILSESAANSEGKETCDIFFREIPAEYQRLKGEVQ
jgi:hypothetical protein